VVGDVEIQFDDPRRKRKKAKEIKAKERSFGNGSFVA
jgi:hypothetical protein